MPGLMCGGKTPWYTGTAMVHKSKERTAGTEVLNIAMVCDPIWDTKAGVVVATRRFAKLLKERGHNVVFIAAASSHVPDILLGMPVYTFRSLPLPRSGGWRLAFPGTRELHHIFEKERIDVVHITIPMSAALAAVKAAAKADIPIVAHSHSQPENVFIDVPFWLGRGVLYKLWNRYLGWLYGKSAAIIYPSQLAKDLLHDLTPAGTYSIIISNGVEPKEYHITDIGDFDERYMLPSDTIRIIFVGRLFPEKSVDTIIRAMPYILRTCAKLHVVIIGTGYLRPKLEALAAELGVSEHISFLGFVSNEDKIRAYNACHIFALPSVAELEGLVVLEAMACGKPILVSDSMMSAARYFVDNNGYLFRKGDPKHFAEQALRLLTNRPLRETMGKQSVQKSQKYHIQESVDRLEEVYSRVVQL